MELQQALNDTQKENAENEKNLNHWRTEHDALRLEEIEYDDGSTAAFPPADPVL